MSAPRSNGWPIYVRIGRRGSVLRLLGNAQTYTDDTPPKSGRIYRRDAGAWSICAVMRNGHVFGFERKFKPLKHLHGVEFFATTRATYLKDNGEFAQ